MRLDARIARREAPLDGTARRIALGFERSNTSPQDLLVADAAREAAPLEDSQLDLGLIEPAARAGANGHAPTSAAPAALDASAGAVQDDGDAVDDAADTGEMSALALAPPRRRGRFRRVLLRAIAAVVLLAAGLATGLFVGAPIAAGRAPGWLAFVPGVSTAHTPTVTVAPATPTATTAAVSGPMALGALGIAAPVCAPGGATLALTNSGTQPIAYSAAGANGIALAATSTGTRQPAVFGTLKPGASQTLTITGRGGGAAVTMTAPAGTVQLRVPSC